MNKLLEQFPWFGIALGMNRSLTLYVYRCTVFLEQASSIKTVTLEIIQPPTGPVCPGQEVILTCTVVQTGAVTVLFLNWRLGSTALSVQYGSSSPSSGPDTLGGFITTAVFMTSTTSTVIVSNATLTSAALSNSNSTLSCISPPQDNTQRATIIVAGIEYCLCLCVLLHLYLHNNNIGAEGMPFGLQITASVSLTWLPPPNTNCTFNYTVNITNSSCSMTVYSSSTSLILTDLLTRGQNYSFAVAVTDSIGQYGPWSDQLRIVWEGELIIRSVVCLYPLHFALKSTWISF